MKNKLICLLLPAALLTLAPAVECQNTGIGAERMKSMHNEKQEDAWLPNAWNNQRTTPAYRQTGRVKSGTLSSSVTTVQVNVNASGMNIAGDAANEPSIAVNAWHAENMVIGWRQFDNVTSNFRQAGWGYTTDHGMSWTFPGVINPGIFRSDPVLDADGDGNIYYNSLTNDPDYFCKVFRSNNGGAIWDGGTDAHGGDKQWMVIDRSASVGRGNIYSSWSYYFSTCAPGFGTRSTDGNTSHENCFVIEGYPYWATLAVGNAGELYIGGTPGIADTLVVSKSMTARHRDSVVTWEKPVKVYFGGSPNGWSSINPGGLLGQVSIDVDHSSGPGKDNVYLLAPVVPSGGDPCDVMFARSTDGGLTWDAPKRINDDASVTNSQWFGTMSVAPTGRIDAIWLDTRDAPAGSDSSALYYSFSMDQGVTWSVNQRMSDLFDPHVGYPNQNKLGDYFDMTSDSTGAHVAWAATFNGEQDVYYSHIVPYTSTGIDGTVNGSRISTYPNPVTGELLVSGMEAGSRAEVYTVQGVRLLSVAESRGTCRFDLTGKPAGVYFLQVIDRNGTAEVRKIVKD
jgi:hypothetical protein